MPYSGSGSFSVYTPGNPAITGTTISSTAFNNTMNDFATGLSNAITRDGQSPATANIPLGGNKLTGVGNGTARTDALPVGQAQDGAFLWLTGVSGTDTITASLSPAITSYAAGQTFRFVASGTNTGAATLNVNGLGAKAITKNGTNVLAAGDIATGAALTVVYDGTQFQVQAINANVVSLGSGVTGVTQSSYDNSTKIATTAYVDRAASQRISSISASVAANALTVSASNLSLDFRSTTLGSGTVTTVQGTPSNLVVPSGATLGTVNAVQSDIYVLAINNAGTIELAVINVSGGTDLSEMGLISTTAISAASSSASVAYSTSARTNVAYRVIGLVRSTQATAGTWATTPSTVQGAGGNALSAMMSLGYGQTWQVVTGSRAVGTTYYNTTGRTIFVSISGLETTGTVATFSVNGATIATFGGNFGNYAYQSVYLPIPPGASYQMAGTALAISQWSELR